MLAQVLQLRRLLNQLVHLHNDIQLLGRLEVPSVQLLLDAVEHLERPLVLDFRLGLLLLRLVVVAAVDDVVRWRDDGGAVRPRPGAGSRRCAGCHGSLGGGG